MTLRCNARSSVVSPRSAFACALLLLLPLCAAAQTAAPVLIATVRDQQGQVLPGASVRITGAALRAPIDMVTDAAGRFQVSGVPDGRAAIRVDIPNFSTARRTVDIASSTTARINIEMVIAVNADVMVTGKRTLLNLADAEDPAASLVGIAQAASQGVVTAQQLDARPISRPAEVLERVPGVVISQHSGEGKANQYYLRGFNLDHGTDFASYVAGMPVNMPTHAHGQGYADLNFVIPELISGLQYAKGSYFGEQGDFSAAGTAQINYTNSLPRPIVRATFGANGYQRAIATASSSLFGGTALGAVEVGHDDGPWQVRSNGQRINAVVRFTRGTSQNGWSLTGMGYDAHWTATDQIPSRAIADGTVNRFGAIDATDGGETSRYSVSADWQRSKGGSLTRVAAYGIRSRLDLFSNFTYFLDDPEHGDQFEQADQRFVSGARASHQSQWTWAGRTFKQTATLQLRDDQIGEVGLFHTEARRRLASVANAAVHQTSAGISTQTDVLWSSWLRTLTAVRLDGYRFRVDADDTANSGTRRAGLASVRGGLAFGPWQKTEFYANVGQGFHSNDARGVTITRDNNGNRLDPATPLVRATTAEVGLRTVLVPKMQTTIAFWQVGLASELLFVGDAGATDAGRPSRRRGVEVATYYSPLRSLIVDVDLAWSQSRFTDDDPAGNAIPGALRTVISAGATLDRADGWFGSVRLRYFGARPLIEDTSVTSSPTRLLNAEVGYRLGRGIRISVDAFNLTNSRADDIDYFYTSRLRGEPSEGVQDVHLHPSLPRTIRVMFGVGF